MPLAVTNQYAKALLAVVSKPGSTLGAEQALEQLGAIEALIQGCPELRVALLSPAISGAQKKAAIERLGGMLGLHALMKNFWNVVTSHRRIPLLASIRQAFQAQLDEQLGIARAEVTAARALNQEQRTGLEAKLAARIEKKSLRCAYTVDEGLLGGLTVRIGSRVLDGSVRGELESLRRRLVAQA
jgi:F-type H+-transporting ATPase subunit delta